MASLTLSVAGITSTHAATDANAARILRGMLTALGYDVDEMSNQEQANAVIKETVDFYNELALATEVADALETARADVVAAPPIFNGA